MQAIVVTFDQFATSAMGCYGNEWVETPNFDRLAAEGIVFDQHFAEHIGDSTGMGFGTGRLPWDGSSRPYELKSGWSHVVGQHGIEIELVREFDVLPWSMTLARTANTLLATCQPTEAGGHPVDLSNKSLGIDESTDELPDTIPFAQLVQSAKERLKVPRGLSPRIFWLHSAGILKPWLPPSGFATLYFEDFEERGFDLSNLNSSNWGNHPAVYAGYVSLIDYWLGQLVDSIQTIGRTTGEETLLLITAARGCEWTRLAAFNGSMDATIDSLGSETDSGDDRSIRICESAVRTPLIVRHFPPSREQSESAGCRCRSLVQTIDLPATLLDFFGCSDAASVCDGRSLLKVLDDSLSPRESVCFTDGRGSRGIRNKNWQCVVKSGLASSDEEMEAHLFVKPDDQWDINDVSGQFREITDSLVSQLNETLPSKRN